MSKEKLIYLPVGILTTATMVSGAVLGSAGSYAADEASTTATASVTVNNACSFASTDTGSEVSLSVTSGQDADTIENNDQKSMTVTCNDAQGFAVYAVGASTAVNGNTTYLVGSNGQNIATGTSDTNSYWAMQITSASNATITDEYDNTWHEVPSSNTAVVTATSATNGSITSVIRADYKVHTASSQAAGTYSGAVKYTLVHPSNASAPSN